MAQMIPPELHPAAFPGISQAELKVYRELAKQLPSEWTVLHSLWLKNHPRKAHAECDFLVITDRAVLLFEVKGGRVERTPDGLWHFSDHLGSERVRRDGPFDQVRGCYYALRDHLDEHNQKQNLFFDLVWGYAVITPDCIPKMSGDPQIDPMLVLDASNFPEGLCPFIHQVTESWTARCRDIKSGIGRNPDEVSKVISASQKQLLIRYLRPAFESVEGIGLQARRAIVSLNELTEEQCRALDYGALNPRIVLIGSAGTGKTMLAFEQARRRSLLGSRVLLTCFNRLLADHLRTITLARPDMRNVYVANYHQLLASLTRMAGLSASVPDDWEVFNRNAEGLALEIVENLGDRSMFDYLIVDEAQDLLTGEFLESLALLLVGGIDRGAWLMCLDRQQGIFQRQFNEWALERISSLGAPLSLTLNCRNTRQISGYIRGLTGAGELATARANGPDVMISYYKDLGEYPRVVSKAVNRAVQELQKSAITADEVGVVTASLAFQPAEFRRKGFFVRPVQDPPAETGSDVIVLATVQSFKGLEATAVVLTGLESLDSPLERMLLYVGASRAKALLHLIVPVGCSGYVKARLPELLAELGGQ